MNKIIIAIVIIVLVLIGGYFLFKENVQAPVSNVGQKVNESQQINTTVEPSPVPVQSGKNEVIYTDSGYSPKEITIKIGDSVTWKNESSGGMWTSSAMHPTHIIYSGTSLDEHCPDAQNISFDECKSAQPGESWSFTFNKKGTWRYHDHVHASNFGSVVVE